MKVLLRSDVDGLGRTGDIVEVTRGYARNFLVPKGLAIQAAKGVTAQAEAMRRKRALKAAADRADAEVIAAQIACPLYTSPRPPNRQKTRTPPPA